MRDKLKSMDATRPVTCGINIGFNQAAATGHSFFSDEKALKNDFKNLGTEDANHRKWMFGPLFTRLNAILPGCDRATRDIFNASDVAGYNYGILRYRWDRFKYPNRIILGSESFCHDTARFWRIAQKDTGIIGDFVWTGIDHLGEVGLGSWEYKDYAPTYVHTKGWLTSGVGRADITGKLLPEAYFVKAAFGQLVKPVIAVLPPNHNGERHSPSGWKMTNAVSSWAWEGCEGKAAKIEVYGCGAYVDLFLNSKKIGRRRLGKRCRVYFTAPYQQGQLTAVVYDSMGKETGRSCLTSAEKQTIYKLFVGHCLMQIRRSMRYTPVLVGEWCMECRRPYHMARKHGRTTEEMAAIRQREYQAITRMQMEAWETSAGWFYWNYQMYRDKSAPIVGDGQNQTHGTSMDVWALNRCWEHGWWPEYK